MHNMGNINIIITIHFFLNKDLLKEWMEGDKLFQTFTPINEND